MTMKIGDFEIGSGRVFIIAEIGNNHNGDFSRAIEMIDRAVEMGADCAKFQMRQLDHVYRQRTLKQGGDDLSTEYVLDLLNRFELSVDRHKELADYCAQRGILYLCTPWDPISVEILEGMNVPAYKVASADLTNLPLLDSLARTRKPLLLSTGMSWHEEILSTSDFLRRHGADYVLLHCNSTYPAPFHDIQLKWIDELRKIHDLVGYSGHERGTAVTIAAVALGACVIERHFTLDRAMEGPDHAASLEFNEFSRMITDIRDVEQALGDTGKRRVSQGEMINRENLGKSLVSSRALTRGKVLEPGDIKVRSPGQGLSPQRYEQLVGRTLKRDMLEEDFFYTSDLTDSRIEPRPYSFKRPWGIPIRYHDFVEYHENANPELVEFHLSYSDMELDPVDYLSGTYEYDFVVHAPELFAGSRLMDLASPDDDYRRYSIIETQKVLDIARGLKRFFPKTLRPLVVANIGGFSLDAPLPRNVLPEYYERFARSLAELNLDEVELTPQTMAPFPWHFGGQRYQNIFVRIDEIETWCARLNLRMCFDVSHSYLTCNHLGADFYDFAARITPLTAHLHLGDAKGLNGEGLQIGDGDIDFDRLGKILENNPAASFIPEIWQGHKNGGEGFWRALEQLEGKL